MVWGAPIATHACYADGPGWALCDGAKVWSRFLLGRLAGSRKIDTSAISVSVRQTKS
jgi:hypothetical protein